MRTSNPKIRLLFYGFCLATVLYNCKTKDVAGVTPFTYTFKGLDNIKLPDVTPTAPAAVSVTAASVTSSTAAAAVTSGLSSLTATGTVPASVQQAAADVNKAVPATQAAALAAAFTPTVINSLSSGGTLPADLKAQTDAIASNPALQAYLPKFTLPTVNGKAVGGRIGADGGIKVDATVAQAFATTDDACTNAANAAYTAAVAGLDGAKASQTATITAAYNTAVAAANAEAAPCKSGLPAKYDPLRASATQALNAGLANLEPARAILGEDTYNLLKVLYLVAYANTISGLTTLQNAESTACDSVASAKVANAAAARDRDLGTINSNYNAAVATANAARNQAVASCHNQGGGRIGAE